MREFELDYDLQGRDWFRTEAIKYPSVPTIAVDLRVDLYVATYRSNFALRDKLKPCYSEVCTDELGTWPEFEDGQPTLCELRTLAYNLTNKMWVRLSFIDVETIARRKNDAALNGLYLPNDNDRKKTVRST